MMKNNVFVNGQFVKAVRSKRKAELIALRMLGKGKQVFVVKGEVKERREEWAGCTE